MDALRAAIRLGHPKAAAALKKQFGVTDRRFAWLKVRTLAEARDWESLEAFATELRRSPIGWEPFIEAAKTWHAPVDVKARLVARLPDSSAKAEEYSALGLAREAAEVAAKIKDTDLFARIQSAVAAGSPAALAIAQIKERFQSTFR
ncbi:Vacuolar protein sorting-associated protein 16 [Tetrabaena socialis]|uniref:Vacuolar protein sorting-associated protein 16 n=1 Tax=Tetrabaena socialis TaxID=47790 RepID=A0A2J8AAU9_9CHLO|nr:Vacuolar protein sorting-associated protein 16 [Tetrabaena socialis]|eukprot:PNH09648.1 Vacuolar protein sorting-associated protein 16 [Tetrabaena socialis]